MTVIGTGAYASSSSYLANAYGQTASAGTAASASTTATATAATSSAATLVTLSAAAQARLAEAPQAGIDTVAANTRAALDALYQAAGVTTPVVDGKPAIDLASLDRRALYTVAGNIGGKFTDDEQALVKQALQSRFDAALGPQAAVARLTGDWSKVYQAAIDHLQCAGVEEKASEPWKAQLAMLQQGLAMAAAEPGTMPAIADDPVAAFLARAGDDGVVEGNLRDFSDVAKDVRTVLDLQRQAAAAAGKDLVYDQARKWGQMADLSELDNRALSAISLNEGEQFSSEEIRGAKKELDRRTRAMLITAFQQAGSTSDPSAFSLGLIYTYQTMGTEERQAMNWTTDLRDLAVANFQSTTSLISMLQQATDLGTDYFG